MIEICIGQRIKQLREARNLTQEDIARGIDASTRAITYLEAGTTSGPRIERLVALADLFDVSIDYLVGRTDDRAPLSHRRMTKSRETSGSAA